MIIKHAVILLLPNKFNSYGAKFLRIQSDNSVETRPAAANCAGKAGSEESSGFPSGFPPQTNVQQVSGSYSQFPSASGRFLP